MSASAAPRVVLYGRAGCHLCDEARAVVARVCGDVGVPWVEVDVDADLDDRSLADEGVARTGVAGTGVASAGAFDTGAAGAGAFDTGAAGAGAFDTGAAGAGAFDTGAAGTGASGTSPAAAGLAAAYGDRVPVVVVDGIDVAQYRVSERALRAALA